MDRYKDLVLIGKGSYGRVYKATEISTGDVCVIKQVEVDGESPSEFESALVEAQVLSSLRHPHIVPYKDNFRNGTDEVCLVMSYCEGGDLNEYFRDLRKKGKSMPEDLIWTWLLQLLLALSYSHGKRVLHRDVKTQNIFLSGGRLLLGDFGLAKCLDRTNAMARTPIGTPIYMAPEIFNEQPYSFKCDVWALGCVAYEMLAGRPAFAADSLARVVLKVIRGDRGPLPDGYSAELRWMVTAMLQMDVHDRPSADQLLTHPYVMPHVLRYVDQLASEGPTGWGTWRRRLPKAEWQAKAPASPFAPLGPVSAVLEAAPSIPAAIVLRSAAEGQRLRLPPIRTTQIIDTPILEPGRPGAYAELLIVSRQMALIRETQDALEGCRAEAPRATDARATGEEIQESFEALALAAAAAERTAPSPSQGGDRGAGLPVTGGERLREGIPKQPAGEAAGKGENIRKDADADPGHSEEDEGEGEQAFQEAARQSMAGAGLHLNSEGAGPRRKRSGEVFSALCQALARSSTDPSDPADRFTLDVDWLADWNPHPAAAPGLLGLPPRLPKDSAEPAAALNGRGGGNGKWSVVDDANGGGSLIYPDSGLLQSFLVDDSSIFSHKMLRRSSCY